MASKDQGIGWLIFIICAITAISYSIALFIPAIKTQDFELLKQAFPRPIIRLVSLAEKILL